MRSTPPPRLPTLLLRRLAPGDEALAGDLQEEFRSGRSQGWYWWQVGVAIACEAWRDLRQHTLGAVGAIIVALSVYLALAISGATIANDINRVLTPRLPTWTLDHGVYQTVAGISRALVVSWAAGVLVMALTGSHRTVALVAAILYFTLVELLLPWWLRPQGLDARDARILFTHIVVTMVKIAGLAAGFTAFISPAESRARPAV